jgi:hypothetical protein
MIIQNIAGIILLFLGFADGYKYIIQAKKIRDAKIAKGQSRMFINIAWIVDLGKIICGIIVMEKWLVLTNIIGFICVMYLFFITYKYYPYKNRGLCHFKKPSILLYTLNSWLPNRLRKRL